MNIDHTLRAIPPLPTPPRLRASVMRAIARERDLRRFRRQVFVSSVSTIAFILLIALDVYLISHTYQWIYIVVSGFLSLVLGIISSLLLYRLSRTVRIEWSGDEVLEEGFVEN